MLRILMKGIITLMLLAISLPGMVQVETEKNEVEKYAAREARVLKHRGYKPMPGYPSIEEQLLESFYLQSHEEYLVSHGSTIVSTLSIEDAVQDAVLALVMMLELKERHTWGISCSSSYYVNDDSLISHRTGWPHGVSSALRSKIDSSRVEIYDNQYVEYFYLNGVKSGIYCIGKDPVSNNFSEFTLFHPELVSWLREHIEVTNALYKKVDNGYVVEVIISFRVEE